MPLTSFWSVFEYLTCFRPVPFFPLFSVFIMLQYKYLLQKGEVALAALMLLDWPVSEMAPTAN